MCLPSFTFYHKYYNHSFNHPFEHFPPSHTHHSHMLQKSWTYTLFICHLGLIKWICCTHTRSSRTHTHAHTHATICVCVSMYLNSLIVLFSFCLVIFSFSFCLEIGIFDRCFVYILCYWKQQFSFFFLKKQKIQQNDAFLSFFFLKFLNRFICVYLFDRIGLSIVWTSLCFSKSLQSTKRKIFSLFLCLCFLYSNAHSSPSNVKPIWVFFHFVLVFRFVFRLPYQCISSFLELFSFVFSPSLLLKLLPTLCAFFWVFFSALNSNKYLLLSTLSHLD